MIENYGFYNNHELDNTLLIIFSELKSNHHEDLGEKQAAFLKQCSAKLSLILQ